MYADRQDFFNARSYAFSTQFDNFIATRNLDVDDSTWSPADREAFLIESNALVTEWKRKADEIR